jgi:hypothetical protein
MCRLFAVDLSLSAEDGGSFVTDQPSALLHLLCTHPFGLCAGCVVISGPDEASVTTLRLTSGLEGYELAVGWAADYRGPIRVDLETARCG